MFAFLLWLFGVVVLIFCIHSMQKSMSKDAKK